jgi:hypothetical protein
MTHKNRKKFNIFSSSGHQNTGSRLDPNPNRYSAYNAGSGINKSGSESQNGAPDDVW